MQILKKIKQVMDRHINYRLAWIAAAGLALIVFLINCSHGIPIALVAATKQATYTFFVAGFITRGTEKLALLLDNQIASIALAAVVSAFWAITLTFLVHSLKGTPEPVLSTLPTALAALPGFGLLAWSTQKKARLNCATD